MRDSLDRFFTAETTAQKCIQETLNLADDYDVIVEPSAGSGSFSNLLTEVSKAKKIPGMVYAFDIEPSSEGIVQKNWFDVTVEDFPLYEKMLVIGNPPFGQRSKLAKDFIRHAIALNAATIAFILPKIFNKRLNQTLFPENWRMVQRLDLARNESTFNLYDAGDLYIPCDYFVWTQDDSIAPGVDLRTQKVPLPQQIRFLSRESPDADFVINGNNGRVKLPHEVTNSKAEHYIAVQEGYDAKEIMQQARNFTYTFHSSVNGGVAWINKDDISEAFNRL